MKPLARLFAAGALGVLAGGAAPALAQDEPPDRGDLPREEPAPGPPPKAPPPGESWVLQFTLRNDVLEGDEVVSFLVEGVTMSRGDFALDCRNAVIWADRDGARAQGLFAGAGQGDAGAPKPAAERPPSPGLGGLSRDIPEDLKSVLGPVIHALYAEGDVRFTLGTRTLRADRLYVDFNRGILATGRVMLSMAIAVTNRPHPLPLIVRAEKMRRLSEDTLLLSHARYSTCDFADPHYSFRCTSFEITDHEDHQGFAAYNNVLDVQGVPVLYLPVLWGRSDMSARPLRSATYASSSRFGQEIDLLWAGDIFADRGLWGQWRLRTDWRSSRGPGVGPEVEYDYAGYHGDFRAYWQKDRARTDDFNDAPVPRDERGRVRWEHRQRLAEDWRLDLSLWDFSDRNFQREYFRDEFFQDKDPETYGVLRYRDGSDFATLSAKIRTDDFRTETTEVPELALRRIAAPAPSALVPDWLLDGLLYSADVRAGAYERQYDEALGIRGDRITREDAVSRLEGVKWAGPFSLAPFATAGATVTQGIESPGRGADDTRGDLAAGIRAEVEARRDFEGVESGLLDLHGLRHTVGIEALWYDRYAVTRDPAGPWATDRIDTLEEVRVGSLRFRNRLQTRRGGQRVDWIDLELRGLWFPDGLDPQAPLLRYKEEGLEEERFRDFVGEEKYRGLAPAGKWGPAEGDLRVRLRENLYLLGEGEYDPHERILRTSAAGVRWFLAPKFSLWVGNRRIAGDSDIYTVTGDWFPSERWGFHLEQQTDIRGGRGLKTEVGVRRVWHDFEFEIAFKNDEESDDRSVSFSLIPTALWQPPTSAERLGKLDFEAQRWYR